MKFFLSSWEYFESGERLQTEHRFAARVAPPQQRGFGRLVRYLIVSVLCVALASCVNSSEFSGEEVMTVNPVLKLEIVYLDFPVTVEAAEGITQVKMENPDRFVNAAIGMEIKRRNLLFVADHASITLKDANGAHIELQAGSYAVKEE